MMGKQVVVIGAGMGGLSAAIHARISGAQVLVLEQGQVAGGKAAGIKIEGYQLDPGPSIIILPRFYEELFALAGRKFSDYVTMRPLKTLTKVFFEGEVPLELPADEGECLRLLEEISRKDAKAMRDLLHKLGQVEPLLSKTIYDHSFEKPTQLLNPNLLKFGMKFNPLQTYKAMVDEMFESPLMRAFFYGFPSYGGQTYHAKSPGAFLIPYYMFRDGLYFPEGGVRAIPRALEKLARELGVEFRFGERVVGYHGVGGRLNSVTTEKGENIDAEAFICNVDPSTFLAENVAEGPQPPSFSYFTMHWGIRKEFPALDHHNLIIPKDFEAGFEKLYGRHEFPARPIVYINSTTEKDPLAAPAGCSNIFAVVTSPANTGNFDWKQDEEEFKKRVRRECVLAGLTWAQGEQDFERVQTPLYFQNQHGNYRGSLYGLSEEKRLWGMFPPANKSQDFENLAFCGGAVQPGAGLPMVVLSGKFAVHSLRLLRS